MSQVNYLTERFPWLAWINDIPGVILGVITGLLPVVMLAILMALVPIVFRILAKLAGWVTLSQVELQTQSWYFAFQVVQVFLVTTMAGAVTTVIDEVLNNPGSVITLLSKNLPKASSVSYLSSSFAMSTIPLKERELLTLVCWHCTSSPQKPRACLVLS